jgi:hypothetical protein
MKNSYCEIVLAEDKFNELRNDKTFLAILTLARCVNALRFCQTPLIESKRKSTPAVSRQVLNSVLLASSVLYEGLKVADSLGRDFKSLVSFREGFGKLLKKPETKKLRSGILRKMRNKFVFHFDQDVAAVALTHFELPSYKFAVGRGTARGHLYYALADEISVHYLLDPEGEKSNDQLEKTYIQFTQGIADLMVEFDDAAEELIAETLLQQGWRLGEGWRGKRRN